MRCTTLLHLVNNYSNFLVKMSLDGRYLWIVMEIARIKTGVAIIVFILKKFNLLYS